MRVVFSWRALELADEGGVEGGVVGGAFLELGDVEEGHFQGSGGRGQGAGVRGQGSGVVGRDAISRYFGDGVGEDGVGAGGPGGSGRCRGGP